MKELKRLKKILLFVTKASTKICQNTESCGWFMKKTHLERKRKRRRKNNDNFKRQIIDLIKNSQ